MDAVLMVLGFMFIAAGVVGCIIPGLPGPPFSFGGILLLHFSQKEPVFSSVFLVVFGIITVVVTLLDYVLPLMGAKIYGTSKQGMIGATIGMLGGLIFFPPFGIILGIFSGAVIGELIAGKENSKSLQAGIVTFIANLTAMAVKFSLAVTLGFFYVLHLIKILTV